MHAQPLCVCVCVCVCVRVRACVRACLSAQLCVFVLVTRAVRLIEIEIKSRFEIARFLNRFIARFFFDSMLNKQGR